MMLQEEKAKAQETERLKKGEPEDMTGRLLREVLDELNITYKASDKKAILIAKVREARQNLHGNTFSRSAPKNYQPEGGRAKHERYFTRKLNNRACRFMPFYYDDKSRERLLNLLLSLLFLLQVIEVYLDILLYQQAVCLVMLASVYQFLPCHSQHYACHDRNHSFASIPAVSIDSYQLSYSVSQCQRVLNQLL